MMSLSRRRSVIRGAAAAAPLVVLAAGCASTTRVGSSRIFQLALTEYHVAPQSVSVPSGTVSIFVHNDGRLTHNLVISTGGRPLASTQPIPPGQTTELLTTLPAGKYLMSSTILSDQALGTYGTLTVIAAARGRAVG
jgi:Cupredoxin-like domain